MKKETIQRFIEIPLEEVQNKDYDKVLKKAGDDGTNCIICGKKTNPATAKQLHLLTNGNIVSYSGDDIDNSQGLFPVGSDCAKRLVIQFCW